MLGCLSRYLWKFQILTGRSTGCKKTRRTCDWIFQSNYATDKQLPLWRSNKTTGKSTEPDVNLNRIESKMENKIRLSIHDLQHILVIVESKEMQSARILEIFKYCCAVNKEEITILEKIWKEFNESETPLHVDHYNALLQVYANKGDVSASQALVDDLIEMGLKPDDLTYQILFAAYCHGGNVEKAIETLNQMNVDKFSIDKANRYNNLVLAYVNCGQMDVANETVNRMKHEGVPLTAATFGHLMKGYAKSGDLGAIHRVVDRCQAENIELSNADVLEVICELVVNGYSDIINSISLRFCTSQEDSIQSYRSVIKKLVHNNQAAIVPKILTLHKRYHDDTIALAKFFIQELAQSFLAAEHINEAWKALENIGITMQTNLDVFRLALECNSIELIKAVLGEMRAQSIELNDMNFSKLVRLEGITGIDNALDAIGSMRYDYGVKPQIEFIRDIALPALNSNDNAHLALAKLRILDLDLHDVVKASVLSCFKANDMKHAYEIASNHQQFYYDRNMFMQPLLDAFSVTWFWPVWFAKFVCLMRKSIGHISMSKEKNRTTDDVKTIQNDLVGDIVVAAISRIEGSKTYRKKITIYLLRKFLNEGVPVSFKHGSKIGEILNKKLIEVDILLAQLNADDLKAKQIGPSAQNELELLTSNEIHGMLKMVKSNKNDTIEVEKHLFLAYVRESNLAKVEELYARKQFTLNQMENMQLIGMYVRAKDAEKALNFFYLNRRTADPYFKLNSTKVVQMISLLIQHQYGWAKIERFITDNAKVEPENRLIILEQLMDRLVHLNDDILINNLYDAFVKHNYLLPSLSLARPLVKIHLNRNDWPKAIETYEYLAECAQLTPMTVIFFKKYIKNNELDETQRVYDACARANGEQYALMNLAFSCIELKLYEQTKIILKHPKTQNFSNIIRNRCKIYSDFKELNHLKGLLHVTTGMNCDRCIIYESIMRVYGRLNQPEEAMDLYTQHLYEKSKPSALFLQRLANILTRNGIEIHFDIPKLKGKAKVLKKSPPKGY